MKINFFTSAEPPADITWRSNLFDTIEQALDELYIELQDLQSNQPLVLCLIPPVPEGYSLPQLWDRIVQFLEEYRFTGYVQVWTLSERVSNHLWRCLPPNQRPVFKTVLHNCRLVCSVGDISEKVADILVNASNKELKLGGGVSHALRNRFGDQLQAQMDVLRNSRELADGDVVYTSCPARKGCRYVFHAISVEGSETTIGNCLQNCLNLAVQLQCKDLVIPAFGTGTGGLAMDTFAGLLWNILERFAEKSEESFLNLELVCWTYMDYQTVKEVWGEKKD